MNSFDSCNAITELDLMPIKTKLMHVPSGEGWSGDKADAVEMEYRRFLYLTRKFPNEQISPSVEVDVFWHCHILDTMKYARDCETVFGYFLHHYPYLGMTEDSTEDDRTGVSARTVQLYEAEFGQAMVAGAPELEPDAGSRAWCAAPGNPAWCPAPGKKADTAWCAAPGKKTDAAWCAAPGKKTDAAWCAAPGKKTDAAWCAAPGKKTDAAWCAAPGTKIAVAWCASPGKSTVTAWSAASGKAS
jgi:hypothetical protein